VRPTDVSSTIQALSAPRLSSYRSYFTTVDDHDLYGCYQWNNELSGSLLPLMHLIEVAFRNSYHRELSISCAATAKKIGSNTSNNWYSHIPLSSKSKDSISKVLRKTTRPDDVISRLTFGFWSTLLDVPAAQAVLPNILPNSTRNWAQSRNIDFISSRMRMINDLRNRIAHWEPMWKFGALMPEKQQRKGDPSLLPTAPATANPNESITRMITLYDRMTSLLSMMDAQVGKTYEDSYIHEHFTWVCSEAGLNAHRSGKKNRLLPLSITRRELGSLIRDKSLITITSKGRPWARLIPL
jgi:hypothetical protein